MNLGEFQQIAANLKKSLEDLKPAFAALETTMQTTRKELSALQAKVKKLKSDLDEGEDWK